VKEPDGGTTGGARLKRNQETAELTIQLDYASDIATICVAEWPARFKQCKRLYGEPNKVTRQGNEVSSATWAVPIRCVSFRKLEKRPKKAA